MPLFLTLLLVAGLPSTSRVSWMRPESFHLAIGMQRYDALKALAAWNPKGGATNDQIVVDYEGDKALTLEFRKDRLQSIRFELFPYLPETRKVFEEEKTYLRQALGPPRKATSSILIYDAVLPNVMVVVSDSATSAQGKKGLGVLAVRYYDPR